MIDLKKSMLKCRTHNNEGVSQLLEHTQLCHCPHIAAALMLPEDTYCDTCKHRYKHLSL